MIPSAIGQPVFLLEAQLLKNAAMVSKMSAAANNFFMFFIIY